jgi:acyl dehydratase
MSGSGSDRPAGRRLDAVPVNPDLIARVFPPTAPYLVGREKVREFARAVLADSPLCVDPEAARAAGYADVVAPPTFPVVVQEHTLAQLLAEPDAGIDFTRVVHGDQRFSYTRPVVAGDELTATLKVTGVKTLGGNSMVTAESTIVDAAGAHVVTAVSTLVVRGDE